jgi:O-antigen ligase
LGAPRLGNSATIAARLDIWRSAFALWRDLPLLGAGPEGFFWRYPAHIPAAAAMDPNLRHPHNLWLEIGTGWGVVGIVWLGLLLIALARNLLRLLHAGRDGHRAPQRGWLPLRPMAVGIAAGLAAGLAHGQVDAFAVLADLAAWNWAALGLLGAFVEAATSSSKREA